MVGFGCRGRLLAFGAFGLLHGLPGVGFAWCSAGFAWSKGPAGPDTAGKAKKAGKTLEALPRLPLPPTHWAFGEPSRLVLGLHAVGELAVSGLSGVMRCWLR